MSWEDFIFWQYIILPGSIIVDVVARLHM